MTRTLYPRVSRPILAAGIACTVMLFAAPAPARAQGKLDVRYTISVAGISIGQAVWIVSIGADQYKTSATGGASGLIKFLVSGHGEIRAQGLVKDGRPIPVLFTSNLTSDDDPAKVTMTLDNGNVKDLAVTEAAPEPDRIPISDADKLGVTDPLTAMIMPIGGNSDVLNLGENLSDEVCQQILPIFDGLRRYDLKLAFKRVDRVKAERGYAGPVVVCAMTFHPVSGHRASSTLIKYLADGRDMEIWMAPIAGTHLAAPFRITISNLIGNMTIQAAQFETTSQATERTIFTGPRQ
jgi:hypothetical protein